MRDRGIEEATKLYKNIVRQISDLTAENARLEIRDRQVIALLQQFIIGEKSSGYYYTESNKLIESLNAIYADELTGIT